MACENDKCEKYGMHHDYENGIEVRKCQFCLHEDQPERSKREDVLENILQWGEEFESMMRCSEHCGNTVKEVQ